ncbi:MAG: hypothetical protein JNM47_00325 [Hyphomonadaceae bacterium]|nr:hypothetical protein [Hyphomonadaceae bacterium]
MSPSTLAVSALGVAALGLAVAFAGRWRAGLGDWARALIITGLAIGGCAFALSDGKPVAAFVAGFLVCAALHRWIDAITARKAEETA